MAEEDPDVVFENKWQATKVRIIFWFLLAAGIAGLWAGWSILLYFGTSPGDGGVLRPLWQRLLFGGSIAMMAGLVVYGMWIYIHLYVLRMSIKGLEVTLVTMSPTGRAERVFDANDLGEGAYHEGKFYDLEDQLRLDSGRHAIPRVDAPWITLKARDQFWPFILDAQAELIDFKRIKQLAEGKLEQP